MLLTPHSTQDRPPPSRPKRQRCWLEGLWSRLHHLLYRREVKGRVGRGLLRVPLKARQDGAGPGLLSAGQSSRLPGGSKSGAGRGACRGEGGGPGLLEPEAWAQVGKKFLGMNFIMRQQLPRVPTVGGAGGRGVCACVGCPDSASQWGMGCPSRLDLEGHEMLASEL